MLCYCLPDETPCEIVVYLHVGPLRSNFTQEDKQEKPRIRLGCTLRSPSRSAFLDKQKSHKHIKRELFGPEILGTFLTFSMPWCLGVQSFSPSPAQQEPHAHTFWCGRPRYSVQMSMTWRAPRKTCCETNLTWLFGPLLRLWLAFRSSCLSHDQLLMVASCRQLLLISWRLRITASLRLRGCIAIGGITGPLPSKLCMLLGCVHGSVRIEAHMIANQNSSDQGQAR